MVITVIESNEFDPDITTDNLTSFTLQEDHPLSLIVTVNISDLDFGLSGLFDVTVSNSLFEISPTAGDKSGYFEVNLVSQFDYEVIHIFICMDIVHSSTDYRNYPTIYMTQNTPV